VVLLVGFAVASNGGTVTGGGSPNPAATEPSAGAPASAASSPDVSAFPTAAEQAALALVPEGIRATCARGRGISDAVDAGFTGTVPLVTGVFGNPVPFSVTPPQPTASLTCTPPKGADTVHFLWYQFAGGNASNAVDYLSLLTVRHAAADGDCEQDPKARQPWSNERLGAGLVACFEAAPFDGSPWLDWTYKDGHMLALATRDDRDFDTLYEWFQDLRPFLP
jgi:hypothetical protein